MRVRAMVALRERENESSEGLCRAGEEIRRGLDHQNKGKRKRGRFWQIARKQRGGRVRK
jgi:hypothetical protein